MMWKWKPDSCYHKPIWELYQGERLAAYVWKEFSWFMWTVCASDRVLFITRENYDPWSGKAPTEQLAKEMVEYVYTHHLNYEGRFTTETGGHPL